MQHRRYWSFEINTKFNIISPADALETAKAIEASIKHDRSVYIRLTGGSNNPIVYDKDYEFEIGKAKMLIDSGEILLISNGIMVSKSIDIAKSFKKKGIDISVLNMHTIKPLDTNFLNDIIHKYKYCFTLEEHNIHGGLGTAISEYIASSHTKIKFKNFGINDKYIKSGSYNYCLMNIDLIMKASLKKLKKLFHE